MPHNLCKTTANCSDNSEIPTVNISSCVASNVSRRLTTAHASCFCKVFLLTFKGTPLENQSQKQHVAPNTEAGERPATLAHV